MPLLRPALTEEAIERVTLEREVQDGKWGLQRHHFPTWGAILAEETGELCGATLNLTFQSKLTEAEYLTEIRDEATQVAAVAVAILEHVIDLIARGR